MRNQDSDDHAPKPWPDAAARGLASEPGGFGEPGGSAPGHGIPFAAGLRVWLRVAASSFGGPAAQIAVMHRILVEEKGWISESRFLHALNFCMLLPGPEAQQLAIYLGWLLHRTAGGVVAGGLFVLPGVVALMGLGIVYTLFGHIGFVAAALFGLKAAVLAVVAQAVVRIGGHALGGRAARVLAGIAFLAIAGCSVPFPLIVAAAALVGFVATRAGLGWFTGPAAAPAEAGADRAGHLGEDSPAHARPSAARAIRVLVLWVTLWLGPVLAVTLLAGPGSIFTAIGWFFSKMAVVGFGGAYAVLAYVAQEAVTSRHWLAPGEMLDGLGLAETTPGPLLMVLQFVGFMAAFHAPGGVPPLLAGVAGGLLASWVTFTPCFLWIFLGGPYMEKVRGDRTIAGALGAVTAAVVGVILNLAVWFAIHSLFAATWRLRLVGLDMELPVLGSVDFAGLLLAAAAGFMLFRLKFGLLSTLGLCCLGGIVLRLV